MSGYIVAFRFEDEESADTYFRAVGRFAMAPENAFKFTDRGAAETIAAMNGGEVEEFGPSPQRETSDVEHMLYRLRVGDIRDRMSRLASLLEAKAAAEQKCYDMQAQSGNEYGCAHHRNRKDAYVETLGFLREALK